MQYENNVFEQVNATNVNSNIFDLSHYKLASYKFGKIYPNYMEEVIPGDDFEIDSGTMMRSAALDSPAFGEIDVKQYFFYVPTRLVWDRFEDFITGPESPTDASEPMAPYTSHATEQGDLYDYLGCSPTDGPVNLNAVPEAAYRLIWNEYFRDENLQNEKAFKCTDGANTNFNGDLYYSNLPKGYFESALPWAQKGPQAQIPLGSTAPLVYFGPGTPNKLNKSSDGSVYTGGGNLTAENGTGNLHGSFGGLSLDNSAHMLVDLQDANGATVSDFRRALALQKWYEKNSRGGNRYIETIQQHFGVDIGDLRVQRPEYLGGYKTPFTISEVLQTSESTVTSPLGAMGGHGIAAGGGQKINYYAKEHGVILGLITIQPKPVYKNGIPRFMLKQDVFEYYWESFAHVGEQPIWKGEIQGNYQSSPEENYETFGYQQRYGEYKFKNNVVSGDFRGSLDFWTMSRNFDNEYAVALNEDFISAKSEDVASLLFPLIATDYFWGMHKFNVKAKRKIPVFSNPSL